MTRLLASFMVVLGVVWTLCVAWAFLTLSRISTPVSTGLVTAEYGGTLLPAVALVIGGILVLKGNAATAGAGLIGVACLVLTCIVGYQCYLGVTPQPLQARPSYSFYALLMVGILLIDAAAFRLYQVASSSTGR